MSALIRRRDLLKGSAVSLVAAGLVHALPLSAATASTAATDGSPTDDDDLARFAPRTRPGCLDLTWAKGTGLIWMTGETVFYENPRNRFMRFRRSFDVTGTPRRAELRLFADTQYIAWLNGVEIGRGPGRSDHTWTYFDTYDVTAHLRPGGNVLAVLVLFQGFGTGGRQSIMQALLAHLSFEDAAGKTQSVVSDRSWRASPADEFLRPTPRLHATLGCIEVQDLRRAEPEWIGLGYNDTAWPKSDYIKPDLASTPWYHFVPEPLSPRGLTPLPFSANARLADVTLACPAVENLGALRPPAGGIATTLPVKVAATAAGQARAVTLDFGRVECGYLTLEVTGPAGATVDLLVGEQLVDDQLPQPGAARVHTTRFILREGKQTLAVAFNWIAFRFAQLWIWTPAELELRAVTLQQRLFPFGPAGHFRCDDALLNRLDTACEHTLRLCTQDGIVDSASREQQQWIGDGRYTAINLHHRFPIGVLHRRLIEQIGQGIDWMGSLVPRFPTGNLNVSPIPLYSLQWVLAFRDYAWFTGETDLVAAWWPQLQHVLRWFTAFERADGLLERVPHWMYIDLGEGPAPGRVPSVGVVNTTLNLHYQAALAFAAEAATARSDRSAARHFGARAKRVATAIRAVLWDDAVGAYRDSLDAAGHFGTLSEGTNAHALVSLETPGSARAAQIIAAVFATNAHQPIHASPFAMNAVFLALGRHRRADLALPLLPARYTEQVESGAMWEHWHAFRRDADGVPVAHSLSHAWGAGALAFFVGAVVGIAPAAPGWTSVRIAPQPGHLKQAEASVVTARGTIAAAWEITGRRFRLRVTLPSAIGGSCQLPDGSDVAVPPGGGEFSCAV